MPALIWDEDKGEWVPKPLTEAQRATAFQPGQSGNPGGINQHIRAQMSINGKMATGVRARILEALESRIEAAIARAEIRPGEEDSDQLPEAAADKILKYLNSDILRLLSESEDRAYGKPTQPTRDDSAPKKKITEEMSPEEAAEAYQRELEGK